MNDGRRSAAARVTIYHRRRVAGLCPKCGEPHRGIWFHCDACRELEKSRVKDYRAANPLPAGLRHEGA